MWALSERWALCLVPGSKDAVSKCWLFILLLVAYNWNSSFSQKSRQKKKSRKKFTHSFGDDYVSFFTVSEKSARKKSVITVEIWEKIDLQAHFNYRLEAEGEAYS